jgi:hypothetical protein
MRLHQLPNPSRYPVSNFDGVRNDVIRRFEISNSAVVEVEREKARRWLRKLIGELVTDPKLHDGLADLVIQIERSTPSHI